MKKKKKKLGLLKTLGVPHCLVLNSPLGLGVNGNKGLVWDGIQSLTQRVFHGLKTAVFFNNF